MTAIAKDIILAEAIGALTAVYVENPEQGGYFGGAEGRVAVCYVLSLTRGRTKEATKEVN